MHCCLLCVWHSPFTKADRCIRVCFRKLKPHTEPIAKCRKNVAVPVHRMQSGSTSMLHEREQTRADKKRKSVFDTVQERRRHSTKSVADASVQLRSLRGLCATEAGRAGRESAQRQARIEIRREQTRRRPRCSRTASSRGAVRPPMIARRTIDGTIDGTIDSTIDSTISKSSEEAFGGSRRIVVCDWVSLSRRRRWLTLVPLPPWCHTLILGAHVSCS